MRHAFPQNKTVRDLVIVPLDHDVCMEGVFFWLDLEHNSTLFYSRSKIDMTAGRACALFGRGAAQIFGH